MLLAGRARCKLSRALRKDHQGGLSGMVHTATALECAPEVKIRLLNFSLLGVSILELVRRRIAECGRCRLFSAQ